VRVNSDRHGRGFDGDDGERGEVRRGEEEEQLPGDHKRKAD
jgi:hypothetical protein